MGTKIISKKRVLLTGGLPYPNGDIHVGHVAGAYIPMDIFRRFLLLQGVEVRSICGSDDYGVAILVSAEKEGKPPQEVIAYYNDRQQRAFAGLGISFDVYGSTSRNTYHTELSQEFFFHMHEKGYFSKEVSKQFFDPAKGMFLADRFVKGTCGYCGTPDQYGDQCEQCGKLLDVETLKSAYSALSKAPAEVKETAHWYLDLAPFEPTVRQWLETAFVRDHTRSYVTGLLGTGLVKRAMTRDLSWGVPVPLQDSDAQGKVLYVWFDAPIGYISNTKELCVSKDNDPNELKNWWSSSETDIVHFIGEDNTIFHTVVWIAMLAAEGSYQLPRAVVVNCYLNFLSDTGEEEKMSKSRGTAVWILDYLEQGGDPDILRYYLTSIAPESARSAFSRDDLYVKSRTELGNTLGNLYNRVVAFHQKAFGAEVKKVSSTEKKERDIDYEKLVQSTVQEVESLLHEARFKEGLTKIMDLARASNRYLDERAPWTARKTDPADAQISLSTAISGLKALAVMLLPFMPTIAEKCLAMLGIALEGITWSDTLAPIAEGHELGQAQILFPRPEE